MTSTKITSDLALYLKCWIVEVVRRIAAIVMTMTTTDDDDDDMCYNSKPFHISILEYPSWKKRYQHKNS